MSKLRALWNRLRVFAGERDHLSKLRAPWNRRIFRLLLVAGLIAAILSRLNLAVLQQVLAQFNFAIGFAMLGVNILVLLLFALRWRTIADLLGISAPLWQFVRVIWLSACLSEFGPPLLVGELTRFHLMRSLGGNWHVLGSQIADRLSGYAVLIAAATILSPVYADLFKNHATQMAVVSGSLTLAVALFVGVSVKRLLSLPMESNLTSGILAVVRSPFHYAYSLLIQALLSVNILLAAVGLGVAHNPLALLALAPLLLLGVSALPSVWSDWGKREAAALFVLTPAGLNLEEALAVSLMFGFSNFLSTLPGWLFLLERQHSMPDDGS